jgi:hypothetical protein
VPFGLGANHLPVVDYQEAFNGKVRVRVRVRAKAFNGKMALAR